MIVSNKDKLKLKDMPADEIKVIVNSNRLQSFITEEDWPDSWEDIHYDPSCKHSGLNANEIYRTKPLSATEQLESEKKKAIKKADNARHIGNNVTFDDVVKIINEMAITIKGDEQ